MNCQLTDVTAESLVPLAERNVDSWSCSWSRFFFDVLVLELLTVLSPVDETPVRVNKRSKLAGVLPYEKSSRPTHCIFEELAVLIWKWHVLMLEFTFREIFILSLKTIVTHLFCWWPMCSESGSPCLSLYPFPPSCSPCSLCPCPFCLSKLCCLSFPSMDPAMSASPESEGTC